MSMDDFNDWLFSLRLDQRPVKRSVTIAGHATSISLEPVFWNELQRLAREQDASLASVVAAIDRVRGGNGLPSAIRQVLFARITARSTEPQAQPEVP
jgi:predicted DNA-binding ribbon-helix-helix protein